MRIEKRRTLSPKGWVLYLLTPLVAVGVIAGVGLVHPLGILVAAAIIVPVSVRILIEIGECYEKPLA